MFATVVLLVFSLVSPASATGWRQTLFSLVDSEGNDTGGSGQLGLLLYKGGTVCDDSFDNTAANAICKYMGYASATRWTNQESFSFQSSLEINMDDVQCSRPEFSPAGCTFSLDHNCGHNEDVFLSCYSGEEVGEAEEEEAHCPSTHPNVYYDGRYCCQSDREKVYTPQGAKCDGGRIQRDSLCCEGDRHIKCPSESGICDNYPQTETELPRIFTLVDSNGVNIEGDQQGLLLYKSGTVCDDSFDTTAANAICKYMGYTDAETWTSGLLFNIQSNYDINMDEVNCSGVEWESCSFNEYHDCSHGEDVLLTCNSEGEEEETERPLPFTLVDSNGRAIEGRQKGLLLYKGGTVCDDYFSTDSANVICQYMGYTAAASWSSGETLDIQNNYEINLDDVNCSGVAEWESCSYSESHNCGHSEDVFLTCY